MAIQFQQLGPADAPVLVGHLVAWHRGDGLRISAAAAEREARRLLENSHAWHAWLIRHGDRVIGYLVLAFHGATALQAPGASVAALYVEPSARGRGIGSRAERFVHDIGRWLQVLVVGTRPEAENRHFGRLAPTVVMPSRWSPEARAIA